MPTITAAWTENQTDVDFDDTSPADTVSSTASIDLAAAGYDKVIAQIIFTWDGSATDYINIHLFYDVNSGSNPSDIADYSMRIDADAGVTQEVNLTIEDVPYVDIVFENQSNQEITALDLIYAGRKWSSA